ncbi:MAG: preprotein translocase subunit YajC [Mariprofundus sp.]
MKSIINHSIAAMTAAFAIITPALAEGGADAGGGFASLIPLVLIMVIFYFLLIRPQQKKAKEHRNIIEALKKGDKVITGGGFYGTVMDVKDDFMKVEIAEGVRVKVKRDTVLGLSD